MAFVHGKNTTVLFKATDLSRFFNDSTTSRSVETAETTTYQADESAKSYIVGHADGTISLSGLFDGDVGAVDDVLTTQLGVDGVNPVLVAPAILSIGLRGHIADVDQTSHEVANPIADVVSTSAEFQATGGIGSAVVLHALGAETSSTNSASVDNAASTAQGGVAQLHVVANTRNGVVTVKVQHSSDNSTWVDLATFSNVSASTTTSERVSVAVGTVNRYLRAISTVGGSTGSISYAVAFARR